MTTYHLISCKGKKTVRCECIAEAIRIAVAMEARLKPAYGVTIEDGDGATMARIIDGEDVW